jgi:hypothetical protein
MRRLGKWLAITFATLIALVLIAVAAFFAIFDVDFGNGVGDRDVAVTSVANLQDNYRLGIGTLDLDLRELNVPLGTTHVNAKVDVGDLHVLVPAGVALQVRGTAEIGEVDLPGGVGGDGPQRREHCVRDRARVLVIDGHTGLGSVASSAPYDDPACCAPPSHRAMTTASSQGSAQELRRPLRST